MYTRLVEFAKKRPSVKWSTDNIMIFLETYKNNYELLWNIRHPEYKNKSRRENEMRNLRAELIDQGVAVPDLSFLRARVKAIKSTYRSELVKVNESIKNGADTDGVYTPKLPWYPLADAFMRDVIITRNAACNIISPFDNASNDVTDEDPDETEPKMESIIEVNLYEGEGLPQTPSMQTFPVHASNKRRHSRPSGAHEEPTGKSQRMSHSRHVTLTKEESAETEVFGSYIAAQLRGLPSVNRLLLQDKIQSMLTKERLKFLQYSRTSPSPTLSWASSYSSDPCDG